MSVLIVSHDFHSVQSLSVILGKLFPKTRIDTCFQEYQFELLTAGLKKPRFIISNGRCRAQDDDGLSGGMRFDKPRKFARIYSIRYIPFNVFQPLIFARGLYRSMKRMSE